MITYKEVAFTAYPVTDVPRSRQFYEGVLGLKPSGQPKADTKWIEYNVGPGTIAIGCSPQWAPSNDGPCVALEVEDFEKAVAALREHKVTFLIEPLETPVCHMLALRDPDGNKITLHRRKKG